MSEIKLKTKEIDPFLCTHAVYAFVGIHSNLVNVKSFLREDVAKSKYKHFFSALQNHDCCIWLFKLYLLGDKTMLGYVERKLNVLWFTSL